MVESYGWWWWWWWGGWWPMWLYCHPSPNWTWILIFNWFGIGFGFRRTGLRTRAWQVKVNPDDFRCFFLYSILLYFSTSSFWTFVRECPKQQWPLSPLEVSFSGISHVPYLQHANFLTGPLLCPTLSLLPPGLVQGLQALDKYSNRLPDNLCIATVNRKNVFMIVIIISLWSQTLEVLFTPMSDHRTCRMVVTWAAGPTLCQVTGKCQCSGHWDKLMV